MRLLNILIIILIPLKGFSCRCAFHSFENSCETAPYIFEGQIIKKIDNKLENKYYPLKLYKVVVKDIWKGKLKDTVDLYTGIGGGDCGTTFEIGETYLIWTSRQYGELLNTNFCTRTCLIDKTPDIDLLNHKFKNIGYDPIYLTDSELRIINNRIGNDSINLSNVSLYLEGNKLLTKVELIDAIYGGSKIEFFKVPTKKLKHLPEKANNGVLIFHDYHKKLRPKKIIKSLQRSASNK